MDRQQFPPKGILCQNLDLNLEQVVRKLGEAESSDVYAYVLHTVSCDKDKDQLLQTGSAPNFQGDYITLCTCKHYMRSLRPVDCWKNVWIAGFSRHEMEDHYLFYLMQVERAFKSFRDLWEASTSDTKEAKDASKNRLGDLYRPISSNNGDDFSIHSYKPPMEGHVHHQDYLLRKDIEYLNNKNKKATRAALLVGNPKFSFLWTKPRILFYSPDKKGFHGHWRYPDLQKFLKNLKQRSALKAP